MDISKVSSYLFRKKHSKCDPTPVFEICYILICFLFTQLPNYQLLAGLRSTKNYAKMVFELYRLPLSAGDLWAFLGFGCRWSFIFGLSGWSNCTSSISAEVWGAQRGLCQALYSRITFIFIVPAIFKWYFTTFLSRAFSLQDSFMT